MSFNGGPWTLALLSGVAALTLVARDARGDCTLGAIAVLPTQEQYGHLLIDAEMNGKEARFVFDTGATATVLTRPAASRFGIHLAELRGQAQGVGGYRELYRGTVERLRVGSLKADGITLGAQDDLFAGSDFDAVGLFGMNMMAHADIELDLPGQHVIIYQAEGGCRTPTVALAGPLYDVPLVFIEDDTKADVDIAVEGNKLRAIIDTGASKTVMFRHAARRLGIDLSGFNAAGHHTTRGVGPLARRAFTHVFTTVRIGNLEFRNMPVEIIDQDNASERSAHLGSRLIDTSDGEAGGEDMLLGLDFMRKVHVWISHSSQRLIMQYPPLPSVLPR